MYSKTIKKMLINSHAIMIHKKHPSDTAISNKKQKIKQKIIQTRPVSLIAIILFLCSLFPCLKAALLDGNQLCNLVRLDVRLG